MFVGELVGKEVIGFNGWKIGKVKDTVFTMEDWRVTHLYVGLVGDIADDLGMKETFKTSHVLIDVSHIQGISDTVTLKTTKEDLLSRLTMREPNVAETGTASSVIKI